MSNKGFTLVELLATIAILGILSGIGVMAVSGVLNRSREQYYKTLKGTVKSAARSYYNDHRLLLPTEIGEDNKKEVTIKTLIDYKYISNVVDASKKKCDYNNSKVTVIRKDVDKYTYTVILKCNGRNY